MRNYLDKTPCQSVVKFSTARSIKAGAFWNERIWNRALIPTNFWLETESRDRASLFFGTRPRPGKKILVRDGQNPLIGKTWSEPAKGLAWDEIPDLE